MGYASDHDIHYQAQTQASTLPKLSTRTYEHLVQRLTGEFCILLKI